MCRRPGAVGGPGKLKVVTGALVDCGLWRMSLALLQGRRGSQGVEEFPEPLRDHVLVGIGHVAPVLLHLPQGGEDGLGGGLEEHHHGSDSPLLLPLEHTLDFQASHGYSVLACSRQFVH